MRRELPPEVSIVKADDSPALVDHFFRHESARLVAALVRRLGIRHLPLAEDAVQVALVRALTSWKQRGAPSNPTGWLLAVANNHATDQLRRETKNLGNQLASILEETLADSPSLPTLDETLQDSLLRMIFVCCDPLVPTESQTALALKTLCGFSILETAPPLLSTQESIAKRITRAKERLRNSGLSLDNLTESDIRSRLPEVHRVVYLLFNEGYSSTQPDKLIREDLCEEAVRLALLLAEHPLTKGSESSAFLSLLLFHSARLNARIDAGGAIMLFHQQKVEDWDLRLLKEAYRWFQRATRTGDVSRYHAEAMIAAEHCRGKLSGNTNWTCVMRSYDLLCQLAPSPIHELNRAIALAHHEGAAAGLAAIAKIKSSKLSSNYYLWHAAYGELYFLDRQLERSEASFRRAWALAPTQAEKELICRKLDRISAPRSPDS